MFGMGAALLVLGYAFGYTGANNLLNGGKGPTLFESLGLKTKLASPADFKTAQGSSNQTGQIPSAPLESPGSVREIHT